MAFAAAKKTSNTTQHNADEPQSNAFSVLMNSKTKKGSNLNRRNEVAVRCPVCNSSVFLRNINLHLDKCASGNDNEIVTQKYQDNLSSQTKKSTSSGNGCCGDEYHSMYDATQRRGNGETFSKKRIRTNDGKNIAPIFFSEKEPISNDETLIVAKTTSESADDTVPKPQPSPLRLQYGGQGGLSLNIEKETRMKKIRDNSATNDAFRHIMQRSKKAFSRRKVEQQRLHLDENFCPRWLYGDDYDAFRRRSTEMKQSPFQWEGSGTVLLRSSNNSKNESSASPFPGYENDGDDRDVELHISASIPCDGRGYEHDHITISSFQQRRLVKHHSKLSVPVLKSMLQKSIRRRRPLPSVRLAMELADKSFTDLIRRLPIICLEDSLLHHEFPLLCWLMVAESKGFIPPHSLILKLMLIVFEIASCPWTDDATLSFCDDEGNEKSLSLSKKHSYNLSASCSGAGIFRNEDRELCDLMLRSMILRKKYGGMAGDRRMIDAFVSLWIVRYHQGEVTNQDAVAKLKQSAAPNQTLFFWKDVPSLVHGGGRNQSGAFDPHPTHKTVALLRSLLSTQLPALTLNDTCAAGLDFHCSNVVDFLMTSGGNGPSKDTLVHKMKRHSLLLGSSSSLSSSNEADDIAKLIRTMMWDYSSSVNYRRSFISSRKDKDDRRNYVDNKDRNAEGDSFRKQIWQEDIFPKFSKFTSMYITARLART